MARRRPAHQCTVHLTERALADLREIEAHSVQQWGRPVADRYLDDLQAGLNRIRQNPEILRLDQEFSESLYFYRVAKHLLVCDLYESHVIVLAVIHTSMDIPVRLRELEPLLAEEVAMLRATARRKP
jgi:toxin ParE1/3/4